MKHGSVSWSPDYVSEKHAPEPPTIDTIITGLEDRVDSLRRQLQRAREATKKGTWAWACRRMLKGKVVRRGRWPDFEPSVHLDPDEDALAYFYRDGDRIGSQSFNWAFSPVRADLEATDWRVVDG